MQIKWNKINSHDWEKLRRRNDVIKCRETATTTKPSSAANARELEWTIQIVMQHVSLLGLAVCFSWMNRDRLELSLTFVQMMRCKNYYYWIIEIAAANHRIRLFSSPSISFIKSNFSRFIRLSASHWDNPIISLAPCYAIKWLMIMCICNLSSLFGCDNWPKKNERAKLEKLWIVFRFDWVLRPPDRTHKCQII